MAASLLLPPLSQLFWHPVSPARVSHGSTTSQPAVAKGTRCPCRGGAHLAPSPAACQKLSSTQGHPRGLQHAHSRGGGTFMLSQGLD